ncbi:MAG TPA: PAS domain S-box protein [Vicinamibacterales bacterium]
MTRELANEPGIDAAQLLQALGEGVYGLDREGRTTFVNTAAEQALGWTAAELLGRLQHELVHHSHADGSAHRLEDCPVHRVLKTGQAERVEQDVFWTRDGAPIPVQYIATPVFDDAGGICGVVVAFRDTGAERQAESAREQADHDRARLHRILREAPAMICVTTGPDHLIEMLNRRFEDNLGSRYVIGLPIREAFQEASVGDLFFDLMDEVYATGEPYFGYQARSMRDDDGDGFPEAEVYSDFVIQPIYDRGGVEGILLHAVDVTAQVQAQKTMQRHAAEQAESEARLRLALEAGRMGSWEWDVATDTIAWSAPLERMHGLEPGTFGGTVADFEARIHPDDLKRVRSAIRRTLRKQTPLHLEHRIVWPDGTTRWIEKRGTMLHDDFGRPVRLAGVSLDVTERREAEEALRRSLASLQRITRALERNNKELDQFAYVASHDLKAPLRGIANLSQWIEEELGDAVNDQAKEYLTLLRGRIHRMEGLIEGILSYSRAGRAKHGAEEIDVKSLLEDIIELASPPEGAVIAVEGPMPVLRTERLPLQQVFLNLITNGLKYAGGAAARITITAAEAGGGAFHEFVVADNGPGIAEDYHEKIWGIFQTLNPRDKVEGTGIGLALVRKIVENKGGRAWVESEPGAGARFHFTWPKNEETHE